MIAPLNILLILTVICGVAAILVTGLLLWARSQPLPPTAPLLPPRRGEDDVDSLLTYPLWKRATLGANTVPDYERPMDVGPALAGLPANNILPPPRRVEGLNGEQ